MAAKRKKAQFMKSAKRYRYAKCPLIQVIFQLRFPTILLISTNQATLASFQETIRDEYPGFDEALEMQNQVIIMPDGKANKITNNETKNYSFISVDGNWKINLTNSFISLSTVSYSHWEDFIERVKKMASNFERVYDPSFYSRVGLRYVDGIRRIVLGLEGCPWSALLEPHVLGCIEDEKRLKKYSMDAEYTVESSNAFVRTHFALGQIEGFDENAFILDCDYFQQGRIEKAGYLDISKGLHDESVRVFHAAIKRKLHQAMEPTEI
jgi:uncharacterized protein (TIGR04255 family)